VRNEPNFRRNFKFEVSSVKRIVQNEPNSRRYRVGRGPRGVGRGASVRNEPNLARPAERPIPGGKKCETNPIWLGLGRAGPRQAKDAKRTQFGPAWAEPGPRRAKDAKRTQFGPASQKVGTLGGQRCETNPISPRTRPRGSQSCETNPIFVAPAVETPRHSAIPSFQDSNPWPEAQGQSREIDRTRRAPPHLVAGPRLPRASAAGLATRYGCRWHPDPAQASSCWRSWGGL
jgi:hypothetical protein